jgi:hypothetical protein
MESAGNGYSRQNQIGLAMDSLGKLTRQTGGGAGALIPFVRFDRIRRQVKQKFNLDSCSPTDSYGRLLGPLDWGTHCRLEWDRVLGWDWSARPSPPCRVPLLSDTETPGSSDTIGSVWILEDWKGRTEAERPSFASFPRLKLSSTTTRPFLSAQY